MTKKPGFRVESDWQGEIQIPANAYWGIRTARTAFFPNRQHFLPNLVKALILVKKSAALINIESGSLETHIGNAIVQAADEMLSGQWCDQLIINSSSVDPLQLYNHNITEVLSNRSTEISGAPLGSYQISPERHINLGQSGSNFLSSAVRLAILLGWKDLSLALLDLERLLRRKSLELRKEDFNNYGAIIEHYHSRLSEASQPLLKLISGTARIHETFYPRFVEKLRQLSLFNFRIDNSKTYLDHMDFLKFSSGLKELSTELVRIVRNLHLMNLVADQSYSVGSQNKESYKLLDALTMAAIQVISSDTAVCLAAQTDTLDSMLSIAADHIVKETELLGCVLIVFNQGYLSGLIAKNICHTGLVASTV